ncbi:MAG: hypothetical protein P1U37_18780 [Minwuia sp.]|nr:hypothetical protein [Minwuia sp.]
MDDYYLKFTDQMAASTAMAAEGLSGKPDGTWDIDHVGAVWSEQVLDDAGNVIEESVTLPGYHINLRMLIGSLPESLEPFRVWPSNAFREWV